MGFCRRLHNGVLLLQARVHMAGRLIHCMQLDAFLANVLSARGIITAKDALCKPELELMELLDLPLLAVQEAVKKISLKTCPPHRTALTLMKERQTELGFGHLQTHLGLLDSSLHGGVPFGLLTEVVGPAGSGKTQLCLMLSIIAALPEEHGGLDGSVIYFDTECRFHSGRMLEIAHSRFAHAFNDNDMLRKLATRVLVYHSLSLEDFASRLQVLEEVIIENQVKLLIVDSIASLMQSGIGQEDLSQKQSLLGQQAALLKYIAESFRIPIVVTNQVRINVRNSGLNAGFIFEDTCHEDSEAHLTAALGTSWAHSVNVRLILGSLSGQRFLQITKSPMSAVSSYPYKVTTAGIELIMGHELASSNWISSHSDDFQVDETEGVEV